MERAPNCWRYLLHSAGHRRRRSVGFVNASRRVATELRPTWRFVAEPEGSNRSMGGEFGFTIGSMIGER